LVHCSRVVRLSRREFHTNLYEDAEQMTNVNQLEMKLHKLTDRIGKLESEVKELKNEYSTRKENVHGKTDS